MNALDYAEHQRQAAETFAPAYPLTRTETRNILNRYDLATLRLAGIRYAANRGRSKAEVIENLLAAIANPHTNKGDDCRILVGHVTALAQQPARKQV